MQGSCIHEVQNQIERRANEIKERSNEKQERADNALRRKHEWEDDLHKLAVSGEGVLEKSNRPTSKTYIFQILSYLYSC